LDLALLRTYLAVVRAGGMRRAADELLVTQPAVSARVRQLEAELGVTLFERVGRAVRPSEAGLLLLEEIPHVLAAEQALQDRMQRYRGLGQASLQIATIDAVSIYVLPEIYLEFRQAHPDIDLRVRVTDSSHVLDAVRQLDAEVGFLALPPPPQRPEHDDELEFHAIYEDSMVCVASPQHPLTQRRRVSLATLAQSPLVLYDRTSTTRAILDTVFEHGGVVPNVTMETASPEAMKRLAEVGMGIAILPQALVAADLRAGSLRRIHVTGTAFRRLLAITVRRDRRLGPATQDFLQRVRTRFPEKQVVGSKRKKPRH
jgi:DNA-binding transcriptional LysR family regulator